MLKCSGYCSAHLLFKQFFMGSMELDSAFSPGWKCESVSCGSDGGTGKGGPGPFAAVQGSPAEELLRGWESWACAGTPGTSAGDTGDTGTAVLGTLSVLGTVAVLCWGHWECWGHWAVHAGDTVLRHCLAVLGTLRLLGTLYWGQYLCVLGTLSARDSGSGGDTVLGTLGL